jgi:hypothetical protein
MGWLISKVADGIVSLGLAALPLTPVLALLNALCPYRLPWSYVLIPWAGTLYLLICWISGQMIARMLSDLVNLLHHE